MSNWAIAGTSIVWFVIVATVVIVYLWFAVSIGRLLRNLDTNRYYNEILDDEAEFQRERLEGPARARALIEAVEREIRESRHDISPPGSFTREHYGIVDTEQEAFHLDSPQPKRRA